MSCTFAQYQESAGFLANRLQGFRPDVLLILGTGLGDLADAVEGRLAIPFSDVPHMKAPTAPGHKGQFVFGTLAGQKVAVMQGRLHMYEGCSCEDVVYPVRTARLLGAQTLIVTNAAGAVNPAFHAGDLMLITDHINLLGNSPLRGPNLPEFGPRFPDMSHLYPLPLQELARTIACQLSIPLQEGIYMYFPGPQYETPAEIRAARTLGADAVGMSTVPETIAAAHCGLKVLGLALLSNMASGVAECSISGDEVIAAGKKAGPRFAALIRGILSRM